MKPTIKRAAFSRAIIWAAVWSLTGGAALHAAPAAAPAPGGTGLASLDDRALAAELSGRGLTTLLDHYFKANHVSDSEQQAIKTFGALRELRNPNSKVTIGEKIRRVKQVADGIDVVLPSLKDPIEMVNTAATLKEYGVDPNISDLEYWGEDPVTQASLKPLADAVIKLLGGAATSAGKQAEELSSRLRGGNDPNADRWERLDNLASMAAYSKQMSVYDAAVARGIKDSERKDMAAKAITALTEFDDDQHGVQPRVHNMIGKLLMASGDFDKARKNFATVIAEKGLVPPPNPYELNEARRYTLLCDLQANDLASAKTDFAALQTWQNETMPAALAELKVDPAVIAAGTKASTAGQLMLQWRIHVLEGELAKSPADKNKAEDAAEADLGKLREAHPELGGRIDQQLVKRMPANKVIDEKMPASLLIALEQKGLNESYKTPDDKPDPTIIKKGIEAAEAILHRKSGPGITPTEIEEAQLSIAQLHMHLGDKVAASNAFLDYSVAYYPTNPSKATLAFETAGYLIMNDMKKMQPDAPAGFAEVYARFLPMAINPPYNHTDLAYAYAEQLRGLSKYNEALKYYHMVPKTNAQQYSLAKYKEMLTLESMLDTKQAPAEHKETVAAALQVGEEVKKLSDPPKDDYDRNHAVEAIGMLADLYRIELKDPNRTLQALEGYEKLVDGISGVGKTPRETAGKAELKNAMIRGAMVSRINAYMALGKSNEAVQEVTKLLEGAKGDDGINFVKVLLAKLDKDYANADLVHNLPVMKETARNSALLTGYLVKYSDPATQKNPKVSEWYYAYARYDGTAQRIAGSLTDDPAERRKLLQAAAERFRLLQSPAMHKLYIDQEDVKKLIATGLDPTEPDWQVQTGLALTDFDLGNYKEAHDELNPIIGLKKLGADTVTVIDPVSGQEVTKPNDLYWEAYYKLLKSGYEVGATDPQSRTDAIKMLKSILLLGGIPERWQDEFESLRKEAIPDFNPDHPTPDKSATQPATQPANPAASAK